MLLPIGYDNFREIIDNKLDFVDKSLFIKEAIDDRATKVAVITRPRRFGKTLNMSMLQHFLASEVDCQATEGLFDGLKITQVDNGAYLKHCGKYPVIFISFKDIKYNSFEKAYDSLCTIISSLYDGFSEVFEKSKKFTKIQKSLFNKITMQKATYAQIVNSLKTLSELLYKHYGKKPWLLIDEYDSPIQAAFQYEYYDEMIGFMRNMFGSALKTNSYIEKAVITGILRISKESLFSGLNNVEVYSILRQEHSEHFGFTENEVNELLQKSNLISKSQEIKYWYNGYQFGDTIIYNPWSIANCINKKGDLRPYWLNTSDNALIKKLFATADKDTKIMLESIVRNEPIDVLVDEYVTFINFNMNPSAIWSLLLSSGYLKAIFCERKEDKLSCKLFPPNYEVSLVYRTMVKEWISERIGYEQYDYFIDSLLKGNIIDFTKMLKKFLLETFSVFDVESKNPEKFYHGFVLGLISRTMQTHVIKSNRESGYGRYDVMIIPKDLTKPDAIGLVLEFKVAEPKEDLDESAKEALQQIKKRNYEAELTQAGIKNVIKVGLAFCDKSVAVVYESMLEDK